MILCCGEALIDMLPRETGAGEPAFAPYPGGAVFNTAIALGRLGARTGFFCPMPADLFGAQLRAALTASGVDHSLSPDVDRPCTLAFVTLVNGQARYAFYDRGTALRDLTIADLPPLPDDVEALFLGGISLVGDPCGAAFAALADHARDRVVMCDPNIRPSFIRDEPAYRARLATLLARADLVKVSDEDLHWLMGPGDVADLAGALRAQGPRVVIVTEGAEGARGFYAGGVVQVSAPRVSVVDTVGAGDTFNAGVLASLAQNGALTRAQIAALDAATLHRALTLGARAAAVTVSRAGANPPFAHEL
ncbi:MAG: carbohydrate kinase family protein [Roseinatronobacter sp.]